MPKIIQNLGQDSQESWRDSNCVPRDYKYRQRYHYVSMLGEELVAIRKVYEGKKSLGNQAKGHFADQDAGLAQIYLLVDSFRWLTTG